MVIGFLVGLGCGLAIGIIGLLVVKNNLKRIRQAKEDAEYRMSLLKNSYNHLVAETKRAADQLVTPK